MRVLATVMACGLFAAQTAAIEWQEDFNGGFDQTWTFFSDDGEVPPSHTDVLIKDNALELLGRDADYPDENLFAGGLVGLGTNPAFLFPDAVQVTATISPTMHNTVGGPPLLDNNDIFLLARSNGGSGYVLALDRFTGSFDLVRSDNGDPDNIAPGLIVPNYDPNSSYILRLTAEGDNIRGEIFDASMNLILDAYATETTYTDGFAGVGTALNADIFTDPNRTLIAARWDDVLATDENIVAPAAFFPSQRLDMRTPSATALNVVELRDLGDPEHIRIVINQIAAASAADLHEGTIATFDIHDPDNGAAVGAVDSLQVPILTDTPLADDNDFAQVVSGSFAIGEGAEGDYTFNFHTDDGFAMRLFYDGPGAGEDLVNVPFTKIGPNGLITTDGAVAFPHTTGDSNVQAAVNLAEGTYSFEMVWFEDGGGAIAEVSADAGDFVDNPAGASWLLLGDQFGLALIDGLGTGPVNLPPVLVGDYNGNGRVEQADLDLVLLNWGTALNQPWVDGTVDQAELDGVLLNWGNEAALGSAAGVPEPATWLAASICGLIGVVLRRGRREG